MTKLTEVPSQARTSGRKASRTSAAAPHFDALLLRAPAGIDITLGARPAKTFREKEGSPATRMAVVSQLREALVRGQQYELRMREHAALPEAERRRMPTSTRDLGMEALGRLLRREIPARVQANRALQPGRSRGRPSIRI